MLSDLQIHVPVPFAFGDRRSCFFLFFSSFDHCLDLALLAVILCLLWITKWLQLEGTSGNHPCQGPYTKQGHLEQVAQGNYWLAFWIFLSMVTRHIHCSVQHHDFKWKPRQFSFFMPCSECFLSLIHTQWIFVAFFYSYILFLLA